MSNYWNGMVSIPGFTKQPDGSLYNSKTGERYNADGTVSTTRNNGRDVVQTTDTTQEYSYPDPPPQADTSQTNTQPQQQQPQIIIQTPDTSIQDNIRQLQEAQRKSRIAALDKAKNNALAGITSEEAGLTPQYYEKRRQATAAADIGAFNFAQYMAARGVKGNAGAMPEIYRNIGLQNAVSGLNQQEQSTRDTLSRDRANVETNYNSDVVAANADVDAQGLQNYINQMNAEKAFKLQEAGITGNYGGQKTLAAQQWDYNKSRDAVSDKRYEQEYANSLKQQDWQNAFQQGQFDYQKSRDAVTDKRWQQEMNLDLRKQSFNEAQQKIENAYASRRISADEKSNALSWAKFNADNDPNSIDNQLKRSQIDANNQAKQDNNLDNTIQRLDSMYLFKDSTTGEMKRNPSFNDVQLRAAIIGMNLPDSQTDALLLRYGLPINK